MTRSRLFFALLALSLAVSLALAPTCRANEIFTVEPEDFDDDDDVADAAIPAADASLPDLMSNLFGASRRFLWTSDMRRELSCKSDCEAKNKKCNTDYSECKRENKDDEHKHHKCTHKYKKCKKKAKKCRSKCD